MGHRSTAGLASPWRALAALVLAACQSGAGAGTPCTSNGACSAPLVCRLGRCRNECAENRDCPLGAQCFLDASGLGACELDVDHTCGGTDCGVGLTCLAGACVRACSMPGDCPSDGVCSVASGASVGVCTDARAIGDAGAMPDAGLVDAGLDCGALDATQVCVGTAFACALRSDRSVACWGLGDANQLGRPAPTTLCGASATPCSSRPVAVQLEEGGPLTGVTEIGCGGSFACARTDDGHVRCWGRNYQEMLGAVGDGVAGARLVVDAGGVPVSGATTLRVGFLHACVLRGPSSATCWGANDFAQLGRGTTSTSEAPGDAPALLADGPVDGLYLSASITCVWRGGSAITLECLGINDHGELGVPTTTLATSAVLVPLSQVDAQQPTPIFSAGVSFGCFVGVDAHVRCWGYDYGYSLGRSSTASADSPSPDVLYGPIAALDVSALLGGPSSFSTCAITDGALQCWGANTYGMLGRDPMGTSSAYASPVDGLPPVVSGACGERSCCAVATNGEVWCWGENETGDLGRGTTGPVDPAPGRVCAPSS